MKHTVKDVLFGVQPLLYMCTTTRGRTFQLLQTLASNVIILMKYYPACSMVVVDFNESEDELLKALLHYYKLPLSMGVLHYFRAPRGWHASICKNTAHMAVWQLKPHPTALVTNLDGDNFITEAFLTLSSIGLSMQPDPTPNNN